MVGAAQPTLANFGSATFTNMSAPTSSGSGSFAPVNMVDESGNVIASAGPVSGPVSNQTFTNSFVPSPHGYWLVGSDGGIFCFGSAQFYGSTGSLKLQRPVVGIVPTTDHGGYWLDASDGGVFSFGDTQFYGSIPGLGLHPAGSGLPNSLNAPIVGMVPSIDDGGYFMVASDGGVFAFGDAHFAGSCPGIGGCSGAAVAVMPDASGNGYWLVTATGQRLHVRRRPLLRRPGPRHRDLGRGHPRWEGVLGPPQQRPGLRTTATPPTSARRPRATSTPSTLQPPSSLRPTARATGSRRPSARSSTSGTPPTTAACRGPTSTGPSSPARGSDRRGHPAVRGHCHVRSGTALPS